MNFGELKKLMGEGGRCVIVENDTPAYIILTAKEFLALTENKAVESALPILPPMSESQNRGSSIFSPNQINSEKIGTKSGGGEKQPAVEPPTTASSGVLPMPMTGKESHVSFVDFEDAGEALGLRDITFEDLGIDELPE